MANNARAKGEPDIPRGKVLIRCYLDKTLYAHAKIFIDGKLSGACPRATLEVTARSRHTIRVGEALPNREYLAFADEDLQVIKNERLIINARLRRSTPDEAAGLVYALGVGGVSLREMPDDYKVCALSPDGRILALGAETNSVRLYHTDNGKPFRRLGVLGDYWVSYVEALAFSANGNLLASSGWLTDNYIGEINIWNVNTGRLVRKIANVPKVNSLTFSPDDTKIVAAVESGPVKMWNIADGRLMWKTPEPKDADSGAESVTFSPDGKLLVVTHGTANEVTVYDARSPSLKFTVAGNQAVIGKNDTLFTFSYHEADTLKQTWQMNTGKLLNSELLKNTSLVRAVNEQLLMAATDGVLDRRNEPLLAQLDDSNQFVLSPDRRSFLFVDSSEEFSIVSFRTKPGN
jgi:WD40 repeat protein